MSELWRDGVYIQQQIRRQSMSRLLGFSSERTERVGGGGMSNFFAGLLLGVWSGVLIGGVSVWVYRVYRVE